MADEIVTLDDENYDLEIWGGTAFDLNAQYTEDDETTPIALDPDVDVIVGQVRKYAGAPLQAAFTTEITDGPAGKFRISLTGEQTKKLTDRALYEVVLIGGGGSPVGLFRGRVRVTKAVIA